MSPVVLIAGLFHETHTFVDETTDLEAFTIRRGQELLASAGDGSPLAGAVEESLRQGWSLVPAIDYRATPGGTVANAVFEQFAAELSACLASQRAPLDAVLLILHGAMVTDRYRDVEGELLRRLRAQPGLEQIPIACALDLHANVSPEMCALANLVVTYRENPHTDAHETGVRTAQLLGRVLNERRQSTTVHAQPAVVWIPSATGTAQKPMLLLESAARHMEAQHGQILAINVHAGFAYADTKHTGVSIAASTLGDIPHATRLVNELAAMAWEIRAQGVCQDEPISVVLDRLADLPAGPIVLVEPADNIGGGAPGDCTALLRALLARDLGPCCIAMHDPLAVQLLANAAVHARVQFMLGGRGSKLDAGPVAIDGLLVSRSDGRFELEDRQSHLASMCGTSVEMGPCAVVQVGRLSILITSRRTPPFDLGQWRSQGIIPEEQRVIAVKAAVAHRRAYDKIARAMYWVETPGPCASDLTRLPFEHVRRPVFPLDNC